MPLLKRQDLPNLLADIEKGAIAPVYLFFGERYLCRDAAAELAQRLLPDEKERLRNLKIIDGDQENFGQTLRLLRNYSLFPGRQLFRVQDSRLLFSKEVAKTFWEKAEQARAGKNIKLAGRCLVQMLGAAGVGPEEASDLDSLSEARWRTLFGFAKPQNGAGWAEEILAAAAPLPTASSEAGEPAEQFLEAFASGLPEANILLLLAEAVDKRKRFYKFIEKHGVVLDLSVDKGSSTAARQGQEALLLELIRKTLAKFGKKLEPRAVKVLLERVGFHPVAVVQETEKLALYAGDAQVISLTDLNAVVGRTREEALYELTEAVAEGQADNSLLILGRLLDHQFHPLVIVATLRNHLKKLLLARSMQGEDSAYRPGMAYAAFQKTCLPRLKASRAKWPSLLAAHPFVQYKTFRQAEKYSCKGLRNQLAELLQAEFRLKSSGIPDYMVMQNLIFRLSTTSNEADRAKLGQHGAMP